MRLLSQLHQIYPLYSVMFKQEVTNRIVTNRFTPVETKFDVTNV